MWSLLLFAHVVSSGVSLTTEQVATQLQQEVITLTTQVADQTRLAQTVRAINNLGTPEGKKDTPSLSDVKRSRSSEGVHWQGERFSAVVDEDGGVFCWCGQGGRDDGVVVR